MPRNFDKNIKIVIFFSVESTIFLLEKMSFAKKLMNKPQYAIYMPLEEAEMPPKIFENETFNRF